MRLWFNQIEVVFDEFITTDFVDPNSSLYHYRIIWHL
jgi:hypothetical protein